MSSFPAIEAKGLNKSYGAVPVLREFDLRVEGGELCGLLGPNGAGKTTIVRILSTLVRADAGSASVAGLDVWRDRHLVRRRISLIGQGTSVDAAQTGEENLMMIGRLAGLSVAAARGRCRELLEAVELLGVARRRVMTYSGGMRRRLDLAAGLMIRPQVMFLDEPTTGLDPRSRQSTWKVVREVVSSGTTVVLTTQYLEEADQLADHVVVIDKGRVVAEGQPAALKAQLGGRRLDLTLTDASTLARLSRSFGPRIVWSDEDRLTIGLATDGNAAHVLALLDEVDPKRELVERFELHEATLDDVFFALTGHQAAKTSEASHLDRSQEVGANA
ncbi:MAG: ATP-binding cassette domain-containing protein [Acidimicrobiales bacterium]|jgi:ABC-2 type transport system ATP-binding protein